MSEGPWSKLEVNRVAGRSRLTTCLSVSPLKILSPNAQADYSSAVLSGYGGGLVAGDSVRLRIECGREAKLFLGTQAFTKIYKTVGGRGARQEIECHMGSDACVVSLPDPIVPYADSAFEQHQTWHLCEGAMLVLLDGATAGREARGERFDYGSYISNITVYRADDLVLVERFDSQPDRNDAERVGVFAGYSTFANLFIIGSPESAAFAAMKERLIADLQPRVDKQMAEGADGAALLSLAESRPGVLVGRALGHSSSDLNFIARTLALAASDSRVLGEDPLHRKY